MKNIKYTLFFFLVVVEFVITGIVKKLELLPWTTFVQFSFLAVIIFTFVIMFLIAVKEQKIKPKTQKILSAILAFIILTAVTAAISEIL